MSEDSEGRPFSTITIAGVGLIGGSLALALRRSGFRGAILGVSSDATLDAARRLGAIDEGFSYDRLSEAASRSDLVVLSTPIARILEQLEELGREGSLRPGTVVTDVGSTKAEILDAAARALPEEVPFIGGHPLAGSEQRGVAAADPFLFQNAYYVLTPGQGVPGACLERLSRLVALTGARVVVLAAEEHDRVAATISHLPQLLAVSLVNFLGRLGDERETAIRLAAGGFRDMTRIASSPFSVWRDILATNRERVLESVEAFAAHLRANAGDLEEEKLSSLFDAAAATRAEIPRDTKGFLTRLCDLLVEVEDTPGTIAHLATPLADRGINIKDIEVLKVREGEGGTLRLAFASREVAGQALEELRRAGFRARLRD